MLWIHLTSRRDRRETRVDAERILVLERYHKYTRVLLERGDHTNFQVEVKEEPHEIVEKIKTAWHYEYGPGKLTPRVSGGSNEFERMDPRTAAENIGSLVRRDGWDEEHELVRRELIQESPDLFPEGEVPKHLEVALNSNVAVYVRNKRALRKSELADLLERIKIEVHNATKAKGP
jgi:hypothetical protein